MGMMYNSGKVDIIYFDKETYDVPLNDSEKETLVAFLDARVFDSTNIKDDFFLVNINGYIVNKHIGFQRVSLKEKFLPDQPVEQYFQEIGIYQEETKEARELLNRDDFTIAKYHIGYVEFSMS